LHIQRRAFAPLAPAEVRDQRLQELGKLFDATPPELLIPVHPASVTGKKTLVKT
jgi:hypothetical protein